MSRRVTNSFLLAVAAVQGLSAEVTSAQKQWALATTAIRTSQNGERHDILGGAERTDEWIADAKRLLGGAWSINNREDLLGSLKSLEEKGIERASSDRADGWRR